MSNPLSNPKHDGVDIGDPWTGYLVKVNIHTEDGFGMLSHSEALREQIGASLDALGLQEEVDYTLEVARKYS